MGKAKHTQAVVVIHGIGEQRPMDTVRGFVEAVLPDTEWGQKYFSKPDKMSESFELRKLQDRNRPRTHFYEYYWADKVEGTSIRHIWTWFRSLLFTWPPKHLFSLWLLTWVLTFVVVVSQVTKLESTMQKNKADLTKFYLEKLGEYNTLYQAEFTEITGALETQGKEISKELSLLKSSQEDFSGVFEDVVQGTVRIVTEESMGSGFIIADGYVVTNFHVVKNQNLINVVTYENDVYTVNGGAFDSERDVALLEIDSGDYETLDFANSNDLQVGEKVVAIGNPLGLSFTATTGIISALNREGPNGYEEFIQTDVSLNPGNSGGPLIDAQGKVIGMNNFKIGDTEGLGFALESNVIVSTVNKIAETDLI